MPITRTLTDGQKVLDWTKEVNDIDNQYGLVNGSGLFSGKGTSMLSIMFDKTTNQVRLLDQVTRGGQGATRGNDRKVETFSLGLPYFLHGDAVTPQDIQSQRAAGTPDTPETLANVILTKLDDMRMAADQTREYMKIQALKGVTLDGSGTVVADMFDKFDHTAFGEHADFEIDFELATGGANVDLKIAQLKRNIARNAKMGGRMGKIEVMVSPEFFDALVSNAGIREAYLHYQVRNNRSDAVRADLARFEDWGVVDTFEHKGVLFYSYDAEFDRDNGDGSVTTIKGIGELAANDANSRDTKFAATDPGANHLAKQGYSIVRGAKNLYNGVYGPANTLSGANQVGSEMMVTQYRDPRDKKHDLEIEMANLYYMSRPQVSVKCFSSS